MSQDNYCRTQYTNRREGGRVREGIREKIQQSSTYMYIHTQVRNEQKGANLLFNVVLSVRD